MQADSIEVLNTYYFTAMGSHTFSLLMSTIFPEVPSKPKYYPPSSVCLDLNSVMDLTTSTPQFKAKVLGITSMAYPKAL